MINKASFFFISALILLKALAIYLTEFSLYPDEAQYWLWSRSIDLGYYSKPPLLAWFLFLHTKVFGSSFVALKIFPTLVYFLTTFAVYKLCLKLYLPKNTSLFCAFSFFIIPAVSLSSFLISTDLLLLLFWTLALVKVLDLRNSESKLDFFLLGVLLGLALLSKYAAVYFLLSLFCLIIFDKKTLFVFKKNPLGIIVFLGSLILVIFPNIVWNANNGWLTLSHTSDNANLQNLNLNLYEPLKFLSAQILMLGPILFFSFIFYIKSFVFNFENKFLLIFSVPIIVIVLLESFLVRANANWAAPALISLFVLFFRFVSFKKMLFLQINFVFNFCIAVFLFILILISSNYSMFDRIRGVNSFAQEVSVLIQSNDLVVSDRMIFSSLSYEFRNQKNNLYMAHRDSSTITNHFQITSALKPNMDNDFYLIGKVGDVSYLSKKHTGKLIKELLIPFNSTNLKLYEVTFK